MTCSQGSFPHIYVYSICVLNVRLAFLGDKCNKPVSVEIKSKTCNAPVKAETKMNPFCEGRQSCQENVA